MNVIDVVIILLIALAGVVGLKRGFFKQVVMTIGTILVFILAFQLKNPIANFMMTVFPFFDFPGKFSGMVVINIIMYQLLAFLLVACILFVVLNIIIKITGIFEKILTFTIILGLPSKILGFIVGIIEGYVMVFIALFFLCQPAVNISIINESKLTDKILNNTFGLTNIVVNMNNTITDIYSLTEDIHEGNDTNQLNLEMLDIMLKHKVITADSVDKLLDKGKLTQINGVDSVVNKYR